jgi:hypothetical protein
VAVGVGAAVVGAAEPTLARPGIDASGGGDGAVVALFAAPGFDALANGDERDDECGGGVCPEPAEPGVEDQADQQDGGQVGAEQGLGGVGDDSRGAG